MIQTILLAIMGIAAAPLIGELISGLDRRITARFQSRTGPPITQAFFDTAKLFGKSPMLAPSPYSQIGANRELLQILAYEPLIILVIVGIYLMTGSFNISAVYALDKPLLFVVLGYALTIKLKKSPIVVDNVSARLTWPWMLGSVWLSGITLSTINLIWLYAG